MKAAELLEEAPVEAVAAVVVVEKEVLGEIVMTNVMDGFAQVKDKFAEEVSEVEIKRVVLVETPELVCLRQISFNKVLQDKLARAHEAEQVALVES